MMGSEGYMNNLPLTVYEFLVYIGTGALLLAITSLAWGYAWIPAGAVAIPTAALWIISAYVTGHVVAHLSGYLIEDQLVRRWFDPVAAPALWRDAVATGWERCFPSFFRPLPTETRQRVTAEATRRNACTTGRALFLHCFATVKKDAVAFGRMTAFINQYGFCRSVSLIGLLAAVLLATRPLVTTVPLAPNYTGVNAAAIIGSLVVAIIMFYRYLKFYRLYSHEVFTTYAEAMTPPTP
jgi:hypothetical protein